MNEPTTKEEALKLMVSLGKSFNITTGEYATSKTNHSFINESDKTRICCLDWDDIINKYPNYMYDTNFNGIYGTRYYYLGTQYIKVNGANQKPTKEICGAFNEVNINKPGYPALYDTPSNNQATNTTGNANANGHTYFIFNRPLYQNCNNEKANIILSMTFYLKATHFTSSSTTSITSSNKISKSSTNELTNKTIVDSNAGKSHYLHYSTIYTFVPCFKI